MILVGEPSLGDDEKAALAEVVDANWVTMGSQVSAFERAFAEIHGAAAAVAVSSCTAGLHLALAALEIGPGDEVLVPSMTFVATAHCVLYVGATPVFVDIEGLHRPLISIEDAALKCTRRTRAVIVMHYAGYLVDRHAWVDFAQSRGLLLIEDAAHAAGAPGAGTIGDVAVFSFYGNKNMTTAEGGMIFAREATVLSRIRQIRALGMSSGTHERLQARTPLYDVTMLGWNYRMDEFRAAVGLVQLRSLLAWNIVRRDLVREYRDVLAEQCPEVSVAFDDAVGPAAYHLLPAILPVGSDRRIIMERMRDAGVQTTFHYPPVHTLSFYRRRYPSASLPETEAFADRELTLPLHPKMSNSDVRRVADALASALRVERAKAGALECSGWPARHVDPMRDSLRRGLDTTMALAALVMVAPVMVFIALAIISDSPGPVFFSQVRLGRGGRPFRLHKFRKFYHGLDAGDLNVTLRNDARMTRLGRLLERTKLDELPQLWNVLVGEMSIVGPRPESLAFADCFTGSFQNILDHTPGLIGPNQVFFRNEWEYYPPNRDPHEFYRTVLFPLKARNDLAYFAQRNLLSDIVWIFRGALAVFGLFLTGQHGSERDGSEVWPKEDHAPRSEANELEHG